MSHDALGEMIGEYVTGRKYFCTFVVTAVKGKWLYRGLKCRTDGETAYHANKDRDSHYSNEELKTLIEEFADRICKWNTRSTGEDTYIGKQ